MDKMPHFEKRLLEMSKKSFHGEDSLLCSEAPNFEKAKLMK